MGVTVYPRLGELLRERNLNVAELGREIERRLGVSVDPKTLYRLTYSEPVQRADLEISGAAAIVLGVGLDDIFEVQATPVDERTVEADGLDPELIRRLAELFDRQAHGGLSESERENLEILVARYGRSMHERRLRELAQQRGTSVEQVRAEAEAQLGQALDWWRAFEGKPERRRAIAARVRRRRPQEAG